MKKRIGITTDPQRRKKEWESLYPSLRNWRVVATGLTYDQAQEQEFCYVRGKGFIGNGGDYVPGYVWSVYTFEYSENSEVSERRA